MSELNASNLRKEHGNQGPDLVGVTELTSPYFFVPPSGDTASRPQNCAAGTLRFNTEAGTLEVYRGDTIGWQFIERREGQYLGGGTGSNTGTGTRGILFGGYQNPDGRMNVINFLTISTLGGTQDFGDLNDHTGRSSAAASRTRAVCIGGFQSPTVVNIIQYVTIASLGNATDFGDLTYARNQAGAASNQIRAIGGGGNPGSTGVNTLDYFTIAQTGNAIDYGDLTTARQSPNAAASTTRAVFMTGELSPSGTTNVTDFVTIMTTGNAVDFGDCGVAVRLSSACSNSTRMIKAGGDFNPSSDQDTNAIEYITIATKGNAQDFGDLTLDRTELSAVSDPTRAVINGGYRAPDGTSSTSNVMDFISFATTGNAQDFGDLNTATSFRPGATSSGHGGL